jgi:hypothetical protein
VFGVVGRQPQETKGESWGWGGLAPQTPILNWEVFIVLFATTIKDKKSEK